MAGEPSNSDHFTRKPIPGFALRHFVSVLLIAPVFVWLIYLLVTDANTPAWFMIVAGAIAAFGLGTQEIRFRRFRCRECSRVLKRRPGPDRTPVQFRCDDCEIVWETGFKESPGD